MRRARAASAFLLLCLTLLTGCGPLSINEQAIVLAVSLDPDRAGWRWTFMFPNPTLTPSSEASIHTSQEFSVLSVGGATFGDAVDAVQSAIDRKVFLGLCQVVVLNPRLPAEMVRRLLTTLVRTSAFPHRAWVTFGEPTASELLTTTMPEEAAPTVYLAAYFKCRDCHSPASEVRIWEAWDSLVLPSRTAVLPLASRAQGRVMVQRVAWLGPNGIQVLTPSETQGWAILANRLGQGSVSVFSGAERFTVRRVSLHSQVIPQSNGEIAVDVLGTGTIDEGGPYTASQVALVQQRVADELASSCMAALHAMQRNRVDPLAVATRRSWTDGGFPAPDVPAHVAVHVQFRVVRAGYLY